MMSNGNCSKNNVRDGSCSKNVRNGSCSKNLRNGSCSKNLRNGSCSKNLRNGNCSKNLRNGNCSKNLVCYICFDDKPDTHFLDVICKFRDHAFCSYCISKYVESEMNKSVHDVYCPYPECSLVLKPQFLRTILSSEVLDKWESRRCEYSIVGSQKTYCPFKDCSGLLLNESKKVVTSAECPYCHRLFCAQCRVPWHGDMSCGEFQRKNKDPDAKFFKLAKEKNWQKCVECSMYVQKLDGCEHVTCRCGYQFCYICGKTWDYGHECKSNSILERIQSAYYSYTR